MQQTMLLNVSTLVQLWESVRNQEEGSPVKQSRIPCPFAPRLSWDLFTANRKISMIFPLVSCCSCVNIPSSS